jgi:hypothetical protein
MGRDVGRQLTQLGDPEPNLPVTYHLPAEPTGEHQIASPSIARDRDRHNRVNLRR